MTQRYTVGELREFLKAYPDDTPLRVPSRIKGTITGVEGAQYASGRLILMIRDERAGR